MKSTCCSINWEKGMVFVMLVIFLALAVITLASLTRDIAPSGVGVDWGNRTSQPCLPGMKNCKVVLYGVDWFNTSPALEPSVDQVAVDWGSRKRT